MKNWMEIFCKIFDEDNYTAITAMTPIEYQTTVDIYPYRDSALEAVCIHIDNLNISAIST